MEHRTYKFLRHFASLVRLPRGRVSQTQLNTKRDQNSSLAGDHSERPLKNLCHTSYSHFHDFSGPRPISMTLQDLGPFPGPRPISMTSQELGPFPGLSRPGKCDFQIPELSGTFQYPYESFATFKFCLTNLFLIQVQSSTPMVSSVDTSQSLGWIRSAYRTHKHRGMTGVNRAGYNNYDGLV